MLSPPGSRAPGVVFALRYPPATFRALGVGALAEGAFSRAEVVDCVADRVAMRERIAHRLQLAEERPEEAAARAYFGEHRYLFEDGDAHAQPPPARSAPYFVYSSDTKIAVASLLELIGHQQPAFPTLRRQP